MTDPIPDSSEVLMHSKHILAVGTVAASIAAAAIGAAASLGPATAHGGVGGLHFTSPLVTIPRTNSVASGQIDVVFADALDEATVTVSFQDLASRVTGASLHSSDPRGDVGPAVVDLFDRAACVVTGVRSGSIKCTLTDAELYPCRGCGLDGVAIDSLEDLAFAMEAGLVSVNVRSQTLSTVPSLMGAELYGDMALGISKHFSGCQTKDIPGGSVHLAGCTTATWRPFKKADEWADFEETWDWDSTDPGLGPEGEWP